MEKQKPVFNFGDNWASFSRGADLATLEAARESLINLIGLESLSGLSFIDIGCGSGVFAIAAAQLGAARVVGIDVDEMSIRTSKENMKRWASELNISFELASILDMPAVKSLGSFDIVYSWGVLHHTGNMDLAIKHAAACVNPGGRFVIAIYNRHLTSPIWSLIKRVYNGIPGFGQKALLWMFTPIIFLAKLLVTRQNPLKMERGMDFMHNVIDWIGGYPYEYASIDEVEAMLLNLDFQMLKTLPAQVPTGCNQFVSEKRTGE